MQSAIFNSANFSSIATDAKGVIQIFNVGAERMLGYTAAEVMNKITPADISDPQELIARAKALSVELGTSITTLGGRCIYVLHDLKTLWLEPVSRGVDVVVCGHSHRPRIETIRGVLYLNPEVLGHGVSTCQSLWRLWI